MVDVDGFRRERARQCSVGSELRFGRTGADREAADDSKVRFSEHRSYALQMAKMVSTQHVLM